MAKQLLEVKNLKVSFNNGAGKTQVIRGFDLTINRGEIVGILGESGSGKTVSSSTIMRLLDAEESSIDSGTIEFADKDLTKAKERTLEKIRGDKICYVFQNPAQAFNPYKKVGNQLKSTLKVHGYKANKNMIIYAMSSMGIDDPKTVYHMYPFQLSGGQNQRLMIAQCMLCKPDLLIADEPTSSIDASLRKKILDVFIDINKKQGTSIIFITHDFDIANYLCDRIVIMYGGLVMEEGKREALLKNPLHPYTEELKKCAQSLDGKDDVLYTLNGAPPTPYEFKDECPFYDRCKFRQPLCQKSIPPMIKIEDRQARCIESVLEERNTSINQKGN